ncbi:uncharacterized protein LOC142629433 [Castanea sativa]|uniref:uncharacterized protein LOC142629433 n=1 Tax=Castanea sativa TaxID=21020 RepID=UPI003F65214E
MKEQNPLLSSVCVFRQCHLRYNRWADSCCMMNKEAGHLFCDLMDSELIHVQTFGSGEQSTFLVKHQGQAYKWPIEPKSPHIFQLIILELMTTFRDSTMEI